MQHTFKISGTTIMVAAIGVIVGGGTAMNLGVSIGSLESVWFLFQFFCATFAIITIGGLFADYTFNKQLTAQRHNERRALRNIANNYNDVIRMLESNYRSEKRLTGPFDNNGRERIRRHYESLYLRNKQDFERDSYKLLTSQTNTSATTRHFKLFWKITILLGIICHVAAGTYTLGAVSHLSPVPSASKVPSSTEGDAIAWNAENIPMPHLTDGSRYVSNPDSVVTPQTERQLNSMLKRMDDSLHIESVMVIVRKVENQDVFRFAQDIFDRYKVGKDDRGLVVVLAYEDNKVRTHTGRSLEADLTDIECSRLQQNYAIPFMKSEQPDSGMLYLTQAIYNTLKRKELPTSYSQKLEAEADEAFGVFVLYFLLAGVWFILVIHVYRRYTGRGTSGMLRANPFAKVPVVVVGGGGFGGGRHSGGFGGGFSGGGFSGGSSGGGGATSSW